jgi:hypothetical protein
LDCGFYFEDDAAKETVVVVAEGPEELNRVWMGGWWPFLRRGIEGKLQSSL